MEAGFRKQPRGFLLSVEDKDFWNYCQNCFSSIPVAHLGADTPEPWFSQNHTHDKMALQWNGTIFTNLLVNLDRRVADERGTSYLIFTPSNYTGKSLSFYFFLFIFLYL